MMWRHEDGEPEFQPISFLGWILLAVRGVLVALPVLIFLLPVMLTRIIGLRGLSQMITRYVSRSVIWVLGLGIKTVGKPEKSGLVAANHISWLDIFVLNSVQSVYFVAKAEVAKWPVIGWIASGAGTAFVERRRSQAAKQRDMFLERLNIGDRLLFFPEGTSTDGLRVLPFKPTLFAALFEDGIKDCATVQPVSLIYQAPKNARKDFYGWWGDMSFGGSFKTILAQRPQGQAVMVFHPVLNVDDFKTRAELAKAVEVSVRNGLERTI